MGDWKEIKLGELVDYKKGFAFKSQLFGNIGDIVVRVSDTTNDSIDINSCPRIDELKAKEFDNYRIKYNDIIISTVGSWPENPNSIVGKVIRVPKEAHNALLNQNTVRLRARISEYQQFLYYRLRCFDFSDYLISGAQGSANQASITLNDIFNFIINLPALNENKVITNILRRLDDKIDLLQHQNKTLETIAETMFKQWFIKETEPSNEFINLGAVGNIKHGYAFKGEHIVTEETSNILLTPGNFKIGGGFKAGKFKYFNSDDFPSEYLLEEGELIITMTDLSQEGDTLGYPAFVQSISNKKLLHNQRIGKFIFKQDETIWKFFIYFLLTTDEYRNYILGTATGTAVRHTSPGRISEYEFMKPTNEILIRFNQVVIPLFDKIKSNIFQIRALTKLRDTLLPMLMSGEVRVTS